MEFGIFNLMGARDPDKPTAQVFGEVAEQTRLADKLGYTIAWFAEHHFSNYCLCASPLMMVAHCASITRKIRLGTAVVVLPLYNPARLAAEIATADALSNGRLMLGIGAGYQPYEFERFGVDIDAESRDDRRVLRHPRSGLQPGFLQLRRQALPDAGNSYPGAPGAKTAADLRRRPYPGDVPRRRAARLSGADVGPGRRRSRCWPSSTPTSSPRSPPRTCPCRGRISRSTASPTSPTAARKACGLPRMRAIRRGSRRAFGVGRRSCTAPCWSTCRSPTSRRSRPSTTIC